MNNKYLLSVYFSLIALIMLPTLAAGQIYINELMASNSATITDPDFGESGDWLELYNAGDADKDIGGYYITDNLDNPKKWMIPAGTTIGANSFLILWADDYNTGLHLSFKLSSDGEAAAFVAPDGTILDEVTFDAQITDISYGRATDGGSEWVFMKNPTPGAANNPESFEGLTEQPVADVEGGFYSAAVTVSLTPAQDGDEIRYTLDGSQPTKNSELYTSPLQFENTTVLRARSFRTGYLGSYPLNKTYFINAMDHDIPVISVTTDSTLLYDEETGIFVKIETDTGWVDKEIPAGIEYYEKDGMLAFSANAGISLQGGNTRAHAQKSLEVQFRNKYGTDEIRYKIFKNNDRDRFDSFNLRSSGNDWTDSKNNLGTMYADGLQHSILENEMDLEIMSYQPAAVYINGEYYGLLNVRERQNEEYLDYYFDIDQDSIDMFRIARGKFFDSATVVVHNGDMQHFDNLAEYLETADMSTPQAYDYVKTQVDIKSVVNYYIAETYYASIDWPTNNHKLWRPKEEGGKWRWFLFDMDFGFNNFKWTSWPTWTAWKKNMFPSASGGDKILYSYVVFGNLQDNQEFVDEFVQTYSHHMNTTFDTTRLTHFVDSLKQNIANEMHYQIDRWSDQGGTSSYDSWESNIQKYFDFADLRTPWMWQIMKDYFELNDTTRLTVNNQPDKGSVYLYNVEIKSADYNGIYYKDNVIELSAVPKPGYSVKGWKIYQSDNTFTLENQNPLEYAPGDYNRIEVEYEPYQEIVINEVSALNTAGTTDENSEYEDWIELYNPNDFEVNVGGYYLTDDLDNVDKWRIPSINPELTTIPAKGYLVFWADEQQEQGILHTNFKLSSNGEGVGLAREFGPAVHFIDTLTFPAMEADVSFGRTADGSNTFTIFATPTPDAANDPNASGIADALTQNFDVNVFPNPVQNELTIELERQSFNATPVTINLYDISGRLVQQIDARDLDFSDRITVSTANLDEGMYLLNVKQNDRSKTVKVIKQGN